MNQEPKCLMIYLWVQGGNNKANYMHRCLGDHYDVCLISNPTGGRVQGKGLVCEDFLRWLVPGNRIRVREKQERGVRSTLADPNNRLLEPHGSTCHSREEAYFPGSHHAWCCLVLLPVETSLQETGQAIAARSVEWAREPQSLK